MDVTNALVWDFVHTKSVKRVLTPIAAQVSQLIIVSDARGTKEEGSSVMEFATEVSKAIESLVQAAKQSSLKQQELEVELARPCDSAVMSGENLILAAQRLQIEGYSQPACKQLIRTAKELLESTMKVLLVSDSFIVKEITHSAHATLERLALLSSVKTMKTLLTCFKGFTEAVMVLTKLADKRQRDLLHPRQRERLIMSMTVLKKSIPLLSNALQSYVKYPNNQQAISTKEHMIGEIITCIDELIDAVENRLSTRDETELEEVEEIGHFVTYLDKMLSILKSDDNTKMAAPDVEAYLDVLLRHAMAVSHISSEHHRNLIITCCQRVIRLKGGMLQHLKNVQHNPDFVELRSDYDDSCSNVAMELHDLERHVNNATLHQVVATFKETTQPLDRLVRAALSTDQTIQRLPEKECHDILEPYIDRLNCHFELSSQVALLVAASSTDTQRVRDIRSSVKQLELLDPQLVPAVMSCRRDPLNKVAVKHLKTLKQLWNNEMNILVESIDRITDPNLFVNVTEKLIMEEIDTCSRLKNATSSSEVLLFSYGLTGLAHRVVDMATRVVDHQVDPIYRNGLMVYINQLNKVIPGVKSTCKQLSENLGDIGLLGTLNKRSKALLNCVKHIRQGLDEKSHPELMSELRRNVRSPENMQFYKVADVDNESIGYESLIQSPTPPTNNKFLSAALMTSPRTSPHKLMTSPHKSVTSPQKLIASPHKGVRLYPQGDADSAMFADLSLSLESLSVNKGAGESISPIKNELSDKLVRCSLSGSKREVAVLCNDILSSANSLAETASQLAMCTENIQDKKLLNDDASLLTSTTSEFVRQASSVATGDVNTVEPLHKTAHTWAQKVSDVSGRVELMTRQWRGVVERVIQASTMKNVPLLTTEIHSINQHKSVIQEIVAIVTGCQAGSAEYTEALQEYMNDLENMTFTLTTMADMALRSDSADEMTILERTGRDWVTRVHCIMATIARQQRNMVMMLPELHLHSTTTDGPIPVSSFMHLTSSMTPVIQEMCQGDIPEETRKKLDTLSETLCGIIEKLGDVAGLMERPPTAFPSPDTQYAAYSMKALQCQWIDKVLGAYTVLDGLIGDVCVVLDRLLGAAIAVNTAQGSGKKTLEQDFLKVCDNISATMLNIKTKSTECIHPSLNLPVKNKVRNCLDIMGQVTPQLITVAQEVAVSHNDVNVAKFTELRRRWGQRAQMLLNILSNMNDVNPVHIQEVHGLLMARSQLRLSSPRDRKVGLPAGVKPLSNITNQPGDQNAIKQPDQSYSTKLQGTTDKEILADGARTTSNENTPKTCEALTLSTTEPFVRKSQFSSKLSPKVSSEYSPMKSRPISMPSFKVGSDSPMNRSTEENPSFSEYLKSHNYSPGKKLDDSYFSALTNAANNLELEADKWEDSNNAIVRAAKAMSSRMKQMADFVKGQGPIVNKSDMIRTSREISQDAETIVKFAKSVAKYCLDERFAKDLEVMADQIPTLSTQLSIITSVKSSTAGDRGSDKTLVKNAQNLMLSVVRTLKAAEAASVKGLRQPPAHEVDATQAIVLAFQWKRKLVTHRLIEASNADVDELGLRMVSQNRGPPLLSQIVLRR
ncbi:unnamed protein product [Owenia fusiformis]|uniref:Vinculin n=1 Tax=Owenia fusiformis TaxID=6347 RepID=A0A8S4NM92_OWEFU|nr:unnamed protein product [Owenia fusiformis]